VRRCCLIRQALKRLLILGYLGRSRRKYREFIIDGIRQEYDTPWEDVKGQAVLGEEDFVQRVKARMNKRGSRREQPLVRQLETMDPGAVLKMVARYFQVPETQIVSKRTGRRDERGIALELMYWHCGASQARIGELVGLDYTLVSRERKRLRDRVESDKSLKKETTRRRSISSVIVEI
jgi:hypothetical protein